MLDAYIIDRIQREREQERQEGGFIPLRIEVPDEPDAPNAEDDEPRRERGSLIIDFDLEPDEPGHILV